MSVRRGPAACIEIVDQETEVGRIDETHVEPLPGAA